MSLRSGATFRDVDKNEPDKDVTTWSAKSRSKGKLSPHAAHDAGSTMSNLADKLQSRLTMNDSDNRQSAGNCANNEHCAGSRRSTGAPVNGEMNSPVEGSQAMANPLQNHTIQQHARPRDNLPHNRIVIGGIKFASALLILFFFVIPAFVKIYPAIVVDIAFLNHFRWPPFISLDQPVDFELNYTRNFRLNTTEEITVGAWHVLPEDYARSSSSGLRIPDDKYTSLLKAGPSIILYLHGNTGTRAGWHRVQLYKVLSKAGFHVVTFDYRGYGDSTGAPSEDGLVHDSISVFHWIKQFSGSVPVYLWGHSLGSAVATKTAARLCQEGANFQGLILESPFNNFIDAASSHPFSLPFRAMPWFSWAFIESIKLNNIQFASDKNIAGVTVPVLILHATDDGVVPYQLGRKLYEAALRRPPEYKTEFVTFGSEHGYGHKHIHKSPDLTPIVRKFTSEHK